VNDLSAIGYVAIFAATAVLTLGLVPLMLRIALRHGVLDEPSAAHDYKRQQSPVPYLGGIALVVSFSVALLIAATLRPPNGGVRELAVILGLGLALSAVGLADDLRGLPAWARFIAQILAAVGVWAMGVRVQLFDITAMDFALTIVWTVGITNALNLLDNMDGLSAGFTAIAAGFFFLIAVLNDQFLVAALSAALAGCALGFLRSNFHPARIYMGDAGSLFLGFLLAVIGVKLRFGAPREITAFVPILVLGVAIFDTTLVVLTRLANRRSPLRGGRDHVSHRLVFIGIPVRASVGLVYAAAIGSGWLAVVMSRLDDRLTAYLLLGFAVGAALLVGVLLAMIPVYESSNRRRMMLLRVEEHEPEPEPAPTP
jgi:UDP-GlcNAc:undecaprenyl-phosphate/decaprenyl-phosphate GlcNAc-1-phosphate transferase